MTSTKAKVTPKHPDPEVVRKAEAVFAKMGMTPEEAIAIFYKQTSLRSSFPITELIPNEETQEVIRRAKAGEDLISVGSVDELMAEFRDARTDPDDEV
jgi:addiction module RelB/DinJ family antitoxin